MVRVEERKLEAAFKWILKNKCDYDRWREMKELQYGLVCLQIKAENK